MMTEVQNYVKEGQKSRDSSLSKRSWRRNSFPSKDIVLGMPSVSEICAESPSGNVKYTAD